MLEKGGSNFLTTASLVKCILGVKTFFIQFSSSTSRSRDVKCILVREGWFSLSRSLSSLLRLTRLLASAPLGKLLPTFYSLSCFSFSSRAFAFASCFKSTANVFSFIAAILAVLLGYHSSFTRYLLGAKSLLFSKWDKQ